MVKKNFVISLSTFIMCLISVGFLTAGEFHASVSNTQVSLNETFFLNLTLKDTHTNNAPNVDALKNHFVINSQQNSSSTTIINGKVSSGITWKLSLFPKIEGPVQIPSITIETAEGILSTQPIQLNVKKESNSQSSVDSNGLNIITKVSNISPYKNEPFLYTAILTSKMPLYNLQTQKLQLENAMVEFFEEPKLEEKVINGELLYVVEFTYLITPLKAETLTIPSLALQGAIPQKRKRRSNTTFFFEDDFDPFAMMQGFDRLKPFTLMTEETQIEVLPPLPEVSPWLPAKALTLEEQWPSNQTLRVGEPFSRGFVIKAEGVKGGQLPHLEGLQGQNTMFKIYADKPEEQEIKAQHTIHSMRKEQYTLIPQQAGTLVLPEISINWWDSLKKEKRIVTLPARTLDIQPALETPSSVPQGMDTSSPAPSTTEGITHANHPPFMLYGIIGMLAFFLFATLLWALTLQRKIASMARSPHSMANKPQVDKPKKPSTPVTTVIKEKKEKLPDLNPT